MNKKELHIRLSHLVIACLLSTPVWAKLPPLSEQAKLAAAEAAAKSAWSEKVGLYKLCLVMDQTAAAYRKSAKSAGKPVPTPVATAPCADPGAYVYPVTPSVAKPLEASGAHSGPAMAVSPPSTKSTAAEIAGTVKK